MGAVLLLAAGFIFGRFWFGVIVLPIVYALPKAVCHVFQGNLRAQAVVVYIAPVVLWSVLFAILGILVVFSGLRDFLYSSRDFFIGQWLGVAAGILQGISKQGRQDLTADFWEAVNKYRP